MEEALLPLCSGDQLQISPLVLSQAAQFSATTAQPHSSQSPLPQPSHRAAPVTVPDPRAQKQADGASPQSRALQTMLLAKKGVKTTPAQHS